MTQLVLGTAQFGAAYGVTNAIGRLSDSEVESLMHEALHLGIDTFDTAADYGDSQARLGALAPGANNYVTKFSLPVDGSDIDAEMLFGGSARLLRVDHLAGVMFHRFSDLSDPRCTKAVETLRVARASGLIGRAGVSIYDLDELELALGVFPDLDLIQLPGNILDGRLLDSPLVAEVRATGAEVHVRSALLQGILLTAPTALPDFFRPLAPVLEQLANIAAEQETTVLGLALRYLRDHPVVDGVVVGATTTEELRGILAEWSIVGGQHHTIGEGLPDEVLDPRRWPKVSVAP